MEKAREILASKIKSPTGSINQKYVYTCFIVKMRINSIWVGDNAQGRILGSLNFWVFQVKKFKFESRSTGIMGYECRNKSVSQKVQIFGETSILIKCSILCGDLTGGI